MDDATQKLVDEGYTPTLAELRSIYVDATWGHREDDPDDAERGAEFDRAIAALEAAQRPPQGEDFAEAFERFSMGLDSTNRSDAEAGFRAGWDAAQRPTVKWSSLPESQEVLEMLRRIVVKATPETEDEDGFITSYWLPTGPIHAAIPLLDRYGIDRSTTSKGTES